jgi:hypothetical protein
MHRTLAAPIAAFALLLPACAATPDDDAALGDEKIATESSALVSGLTIQDVAAAEPGDARGAADAVLAREDHGRCKTRTRDPEQPNVVIVRLHDCVGHLGRHHVSGEIRVTFSDNPDGSLHAAHESVWLEIDGRPATRRAAADVTRDGETKHVVWHGESTHVNAKGDEVHHTADHFVDVDLATRCRVLDGTGLTRRGDQEIRSTLDAVTICELEDGSEACPTGTVVHENVTKGRVVEKRFDGSATAIAEIHSRHGDTTRAIPLECTPKP